MSDKKLLEESTIRRFMQLANIKPINDGLIAEASHKKPEKMEEKKAEEKKKAHKAGEKPAHVEEEKVEEGLEEMYGTKSMEEEGVGHMEEMYKEEGLEEAEEEGGEMGGGDVRAALEQIKAGVDALLGMIEGGASVELDIEEEPEAGEGGEGEMDAEAEAYTEEGLEEVAHDTKMEEEGLEEGEMPAGLKAHLAKKKGAKAPAKGEEKKKPEMEEEALAEELTRRVGFRPKRRKAKSSRQAKVTNRLQASQESLIIRR